MWRRRSSRGISRTWRARQQGLFFCPCKVQSLFEDLNLHGLATQKTFELADAVLELAGFRSRPISDTRETMPLHFYGTSPHFRRHRSNRHAARFSKPG